MSVYPVTWWLMMASIEEWQIRKVSSLIVQFFVIFGEKNSHKTRTCSYHRINIFGRLIIHLNLLYGPWLCFRLLAQYISKCFKLVGLGISFLNVKYKNYFQNYNIILANGLHNLNQFLLTNHLTLSGTLWYRWQHCTFCLFLVWV